VGEAHSRSPPRLRHCTGLAGAHHERADGSGYHRGLTNGELEPAGRILAAADCYHALGEIRAHRIALDPAGAADLLRSLARDGVLDGGAVNAVLAAAGHEAPKRSGTLPAGLTERDAEVLALLALGLTTRLVAERLVISPKTADHHVQHIYTKIGVSTRGAAALFAIEHDVVRSRFRRPLG
jgi:DNA-binding NarL/FixJ family response regulator